MYFSWNDVRDLFGKLVKGMWFSNASFRIPYAALGSTILSASSTKAFLIKLAGMSSVSDLCKAHILMKSFV